MDTSIKNASILQFLKRKISNSPPRADNSLGSDVTKSGNPKPMKIHVTEQQQPNEEKISNGDTNVFQDHSKLTYHINSTLDAEHFLNILEKREKSIIERIDNDRRLQIKENRKHLIPIVECIIMCGRQELALRGHRGETNKTLSVNVNDSNNIGNFLSILKNRAKGDKFLRTDETTDISTSEQLTLCVRYIDEDGNLNEDFLKFIEVENLTGSHLSSAILNGLIECGLDCQYLIGQGYDGASNMSGKCRGVQSYVQTQYPKAVYVHCAAHSLNLAVSTASDIQQIRNCLGVIEKMWIQRYDSVNDFSELLPYVMLSLDEISEWKDSSDASMLRHAIDTEF
ncbi:zinc finger MYM-type protein 1-like [Acyrthosiphon pisum]|uniref:DUF4371 domain-containing protein n=1 Tax=Acyrthosiphon pisum TaxID=7029 RepID=A0A8R2NS33_ACYPI|nr:zinc finger MYM-type protein 1-like [Acyrthosiphon pisum]